MTRKVRSMFGKSTSWCVFYLIMISALTILLADCGKRTPPVPPKEKVLQRVDLQGFQRGDQVILSWKMPVRNASKGSVLNISRADVYRLAEPIVSPQQISEDEFANRATLIAALNIKDSDFGLQTLQYRDTLEFAGQAARLRYAIRFVNSAGQKAAYSNFFLIEPASAVAGRPNSLTAHATQSAIDLSWNAPTTNIDASTPARLIGYNVYRSTSEKSPGTLLNKAPITDTRFADEFFDFDKNYFYFVRAVSVGRTSEPIESSESNILQFKAVDTFAPSRPDALTVAASPTAISIFFAVNPEKDVLGYAVYRSTDPTIPLEKWTRLTAEPLKKNTYLDDKVESGKTYYYYITAIDTHGNVSSPSIVVSDTVP